MKRSTAGVALVLMLVATGARADDLPAARVGNWDTTVTIAGQPTGALQRVCRTQPTYDPGQSFDKFEKAGMTCSKKDVSTHGLVVTLDYLCQLKDTEITSHSETTFTGDTAYHSDVHTRYASAANGSVSDVTISVEGKWTGPCTEGDAGK